MTGEPKNEPPFTNELEKREQFRAQDVTEQGLEFIARWEGCVLHPYDDGGRRGLGNATIGIGHLIHYGPYTLKDVQRYQGFSYEKALALLHHDVITSVRIVRELALPEHVIRFQTFEFDALVSFGFNCGPGALLGGIARDLRNGNKAGAMGVLREYVHAGGRIVPGLRNRREAESRLFLHGKYR